MNIPIIVGGCLTGTAWLVVFFLLKWVYFLGSYKGWESPLVGSDIPGS